jgi:hypothetical protein
MLDMMTRDIDEGSGPDAPRDGEPGRGGRQGADGSDAGRSCADGEHRGRRRHRRRHHHHGGRKERVLHTRISEQLSEDIRRLADDLRVPASNLVRNVLEEVFTMVESVSDDVGELFEDVLDEAGEARERVRRRARRRHRRGETRQGSGADRARRFERWVDEALGEEEPARPEAPVSQEAAPGGAASRRAAAGLDDVLGWQPLILNHDRRCAGCGAELPRGGEAFLGLTRNGLGDTAVCRSCTGSAS